jgi:serine/tyrosine/threonine adenylyltransferase
VAAVTAVLDAFPDRFGEAWRAGARAKLGLATEHEVDADLFDDLLRGFHEQGADHTGAFRAMSSVVRGDAAPLRAWLLDPSALDGWLARYRQRLGIEGRDPEAVAAAMDAVNPAVIPRNHLVEEALDAGTAGDLAPFAALLAEVTDPFGTERPPIATPCRPHRGSTTASRRSAAPEPNESGRGRGERQRLRAVVMRARWVSRYPLGPRCGSRCSATRCR